MNEEVTLFIQALDAPWKVEVAEKLRTLVHEVIPSVEERIQYKKPHFLKDGHYAAVISPSKDAITFMVMNTSDIEVPAHFGGPVERKWLKIKEKDEIDVSLLKDILTAASATL